MSLTMVNSGSTRTFGVWSYAGWKRRRTAPLYTFVRFRSTLGWTMEGRGTAWCWWDYVAVNIRLGNEVEEVLRRDGDNNNGYRGRGGRGGEKKGKRFVK
jgi:hypothetical protein